MTKYFSLLLIPLILFACGKEKGGKITSDVVNNPASLQDDGNKAVPGFRFETTEHDFGKMKEGEKVMFEFRFTNDGLAPLLISDVRASCGCTTPHWPKGVIQPGASDVIKVEYDSKGRPGQFNKSVIITANTYPNTSKLTILGLVEE